MQDHQGSVTLTLTLMMTCPCPLPLGNNNVPSHSTSFQQWQQCTLALSMTMTTCYQHHSCSLPDDNMKTMMCPHPLDDQQWWGALALTLSPTTTTMMMLCSWLPLPSASAWQWHAFSLSTMWEWWCSLSLSLLTIMTTWWGWIHPCPLPNDNTTRATSPYFLAHEHKYVYTCRFTVCECMCACSHMLPACLYPWVNPCRYGYRSPETYPLENLYPEWWVQVFGGSGMAMAPDTLLPVCLLLLAILWVLYLYNCNNPYMAILIIIPYCQRHWKSKYGSSTVQSIPIYSPCRYGRSHIWYGWQP